MSGLKYAIVFALLLQACTSAKKSSTSNEDSDLSSASKKESTGGKFNLVEQKPEPIGGMTAFFRHIQENLTYPEKARREGTEGTVLVEFIVERDSTLSNVTAKKGIGNGCDEEAVKVVQNSPPWSPGRQRGEAVRVRMTVPIRFTLLDDTKKPAEE